MKQMELKKKSRDLVNIMSGGDVVKKQLIRGLDVFDFFGNFGNLSGIKKT